MLSHKIPATYLILHHTHLSNISPQIQRFIVNSSSSSLEIFRNGKVHYESTTADTTTGGGPARAHQLRRHFPGFRRPRQPTHRAEDAAMMQAAETAMLGQTQKRGPAATINERAGFVGHDQVTEAARQGGVTVAQTDIPGSRIITESVAGQVVGQYREATPVLAATGAARQAMVTIGEALEAAGRTAGAKAVDHSDAAAIQAAECRATGSNLITPGGLAAAAQSAAAYNDALGGNQGKVKLADILTGAAAKLPADKAATREYAEGIISAELLNDPNLKMHAGGVAEAVAEAARMNEKGHA